jgi:amyloid beta precursor protein binding protein 1
MDISPGGGGYILGKLVYCSIMIVPRRFRYNDISCSRKLKPFELTLLPQNEEIEQLLDGTIKFTMILYTAPLSRSRFELIQNYGLKHNVPTITVHSAGFYSYFRINLPGNFPIVDTHPDSTATTDLRLLSPWEELSKFTADLTDNLENLSAHEHGHIPYVALLLHYLGQWNQSNGSLPNTYKEKTAFRSTVAAGARTDTPEGGEENFDEAVAAVLKTISSPSLPSTVREVFDYTPNEVHCNI